MKKNQNNSELYQKIEDKLKTVYDPEFPLVDMFTLGLIYWVNLDVDKCKCNITMTFTTPTCPMADMMIALVQNAVLEVIPDWEVDIGISFDPIWSPEMIKDPDIKKMFM